MNTTVLEKLDMNTDVVADLQALSRAHETANAASASWGDWSRATGWNNWADKG